MEKSTFLLESALKDINSKFTKAGWVEIFRNASEHSGGVYCYLVVDEKLAENLRSREKTIWKGGEGRPSIGTYYLPDGVVTRYSSFRDEGIEPFLYCRYFPEEKYIDVSEEFVNYFKLYERGASKQERTYYFYDELGEKEEVIVITPDMVRLKQRFLMEYISVRRMHFVICFDFMALGNVPLAEYDVEFQNKDYVGDWFNYNHLIRNAFGSIEMQSWISGKIAIKHDPQKAGKTWYGSDFQYEEFIVGYDNTTGDIIWAPCDSEEHQFFVPIFFKKEVLNKYYHNPTKFEVDGFRLSCNAFSLKMDNNIDDYVVVFLNDLRMLPQKEQLHWKHYNIAPEPGMGISGSYYDTMIKGSWARKSDALDIRFKQEYELFNKRWFEKYGWYFYKQPSGSDVYLFNGLHLPADDSVVAFCDQILIVVKFTIDSLNEEMLVKDLPKVDMEKGIAKLERFIKFKGYDLPDMFSFLRHLQDLRSGLVVHKFSESNKNAKRALAYFKMENEDYRDVAIAVIGKSLWTLNTLSRLFLDPAEDDADLF